jgi:hypothetical protein
MAIAGATTGAIYGKLTSTAMIAEATTSGATATYQITATAHRTIDPNIAYALNSTAQALIDSTYYDQGWNLFTGQVRLTVATTVTVTGNWLTMTALGSFISWSLNVNGNVADTTAIGDTWKSTTFVQNGMTLSLKRYYIDSTFWSYVSAAQSIIFQIWEDAVTGFWMRGFPTMVNPSFKTGAVDDESINVQLTGPVTRF